MTRQLGQQRYVQTIENGAKRLKPKDDWEVKEDKMLHKVEVHLFE